MDPGQRFASLTVIEVSEERRHGERVVLLRCDCGNDASSVGSTLRAGKKRSCGCHRFRPRMDSRTHAELWDADWLVQQYVREAKSMSRIADELGCSYTAVQKALHRADISVRKPWQEQVAHGHALAGANSPVYRTWIGMRVRCYNPNFANYKHYGGRGITVCDRWRDSFENFLADMGERPEGTSIDRIDVDGNYEPGNCRWATQSEQMANRRPRAVTPRS